MLILTYIISSATYIKWIQSKKDQKDLAPDFAFPNLMVNDYWCNEYLFGNNIYENIQYEANKIK